MLQGEYTSNQEKKAEPITQLEKYLAIFNTLRKNELDKKEYRTSEKGFNRPAGNLEKSKTQDRKLVRKRGHPRCSQVEYPQFSI